MDISITILDQCPRCGGRQLYTVDAGEGVNFLCRSCDRCWHVAPDGPERVDPSACPGCEWRATCHERWDVDPR